MKISLTSLSSLFLWQLRTAGECVSAPIRLVTTVGDRVRASQIIKTLMLAQCYWSLPRSISWAAGRPLSFTGDSVSFTEGLCSALVKTFLLLLWSKNVCTAQTRAAGFGKICTTTDTQSYFNIFLVNLVILKRHNLWSEYNHKRINALPKIHQSLITFKLMELWML